MPSQTLSYKYFEVGYKSRSDLPIIFLPIINFIFVIISKLRFKCPVHQFYIIIHCLIKYSTKDISFFNAFGFDF